MSLKQAVPFLKAVARSNTSSGRPSQYTFHEGYCFAQNPAILAAYPTPHILGTFGLSAEDLEAALSRMEDEPLISAGDETLILRSGRLRSSIKVFEANIPAHSVDATDEEWEVIPDGFVQALKKATLFVSSRGTWQTSVKVDRTTVTAISDRSAIEVTTNEVDVSEPISLTDSCVRYLESLDDPDRYQLLQGAALFLWSPTGAWARCQLSVYRWPAEVIAKVFEKAGDDTPPIELTQDWRDALGDMLALSEGYVEVNPEGVKGVSEHATHDVPFPTGVDKTTRWSPSVVKQLMAAAERWDPDSAGPTLFTGPDCRGVVAKQR